jgi:hypothetical protein
MVQPTRASRAAQGQIQSHQRVAPVADLHLSHTERLPYERSTHQQRVALRQAVTRLVSDLGSTFVASQPATSRALPLVRVQTPL